MEAETVKRQEALPHCVPAKNPDHAHPASLHRSQAAFVEAETIKRQEALLHEEEVAAAEEEQRAAARAEVRLACVTGRCRTCAAVWTDWQRAAAPAAPAAVCSSGTRSRGRPACRFAHVRCNTP